MTDPVFPSDFPADWFSPGTVVASSTTTASIEDIQWLWDKVHENDKVIVTGSVKMQAQVQAQIERTGLGAFFTVILNEHCPENQVLVLPKGLIDPTLVRIRLGDEPDA